MWFPVIVIVLLLMLMLRLNRLARDVTKLRTELTHLRSSVDGIGAAVTPHPAVLGGERSSSVNPQV
jgi:hypothetical protein